MPISEQKRIEQAAFDIRVDILRRRMSQRQMMAYLKCSSTKIRAAISRLGSKTAIQHISDGNHVVAGGIIHRCTCGWQSRPWFSNMLASAAGVAHREEMERIADDAMMRKPSAKDEGSHAS